VNIDVAKSKVLVEEAWRVATQQCKRQLQSPAWASRHTKGGPHRNSRLVGSFKGSSGHRRKPGNQRM